MQLAQLKTSPNDSQETMDLAGLMAMLRKLLASVRVTASTPVARNNPDMAIETMAGVCLKFPPNLIKATIDEMCQNPEAVWPSTGEMVDVLKRKVRLAESAHTASQKPKGERYVSKADVERALRSDAGQHSLAVGYGPSFVLDIKAGTTIEQASTDAYKRKRKAALDERLEITRQLEAGCCPIAPDVKGAQLRQLISLGKSVVTKNDRLIKLYGN